MQKSNAPTKLTVAFASGAGAGPVNTVPLTPGATAGTASYQTGFTSVNMEPIASGGIPPFGADFNGLFKAATTAQIWQQSGYMWPFDSTFAGNANIGGYPAGSALMMGSGKGLWLNQTDNNTQSPDATGSAGWLGLPAAGTSTINTTGGTTTPDPSVLGVTTLLVTGALASNATLRLPLTPGARWIVANNTTGSFTLTVQGATGTGVGISQGSALTVFTDGTNYFAASANISGQYLPIDGTAVAATKLATARAFSITGLATAAAINFDGTGNVTFNVTALNVAGALGYTPANDAQVVHIAGTETVTGAKTFSQSIIAPGFFTPTSGGQGYCQLAFGSPTNTGVLRFFKPDGTRLGYFGSSMGAGSDLAITPETGVLAISGSATFSGSITYTTSNATSSDRRLKRSIRKFSPRPLHRTVSFVSYTLRENGWHGLGSIAQAMQKTAPEHVTTFKKLDKRGREREYLGIDYTRAAYEQAMWAGQEIDRLTKRIEKLERSRLPRKAGFLKSLWEKVW